MGQATAQIVKQHVRLSFIGSGSPAEVAQQFKEVLLDQTVCFPISDLSMKSIQKNLTPDRVENVISYKTVKLIERISEQDYFLFTSPSNVEAFLEGNIQLPSGKYFAIGPSTKLRLTENGIESRQSAGSTLLSMIDKVI